MAIEFIKFQDIDNKITGKGTEFVSFYSDSCGPCKMFAPVLEDVAKDYKVYKVNIDTDQDVRNSEARSVPFTRVYFDGKVVDRITGFVTKESLLAPR